MCVREKRKETTLAFDQKRLCATAFRLNSRVYQFRVSLHLQDNNVGNKI